MAVDFRGHGEFWGAPERFTDPFMLPSNQFVPKEFYKVLEFARFLACRNPVFYNAALQIAAHFVTDVEFRGKAGDSREQREIKLYLKDKLQILDVLRQAGLEYFIYGNAFLRIYYPFNRYLVDNRDNEYKLYAVTAFGNNIKYNYKDMTYSVPDPKQRDVPASQRRIIDLKFIDRKSTEASRIKIMFIDPTRMFLSMNFASGKCQYIWAIEEVFKAAVREGTKIHQVNETPMDILKAIKENQDFMFNDGVIFHFKNPCISGISLSGWGVPPILLSYSDLHQLQVLNCYNEAISLDYVTPTRVITPAAAGKAGDATTGLNLGKWAATVKQFLKNKRENPTAIHTMAYPIEYQELGASGKQLAPVELIDMAKKNILNNMGAPAALWEGSLDINQMPAAIRRMQATFSPLARQMDQCLKWATKEVLNYMEKQQIGVALATPAEADNLEMKHILLQLASGGELSRETAYKHFGIEDPIEEQRRRTEEDSEIEELKQQEQIKLERKQTTGSVSQVVDAEVQAQGGGTTDPMAAAGAPPAGGGGGAPPLPGQNPVTPLDIQQQAANIAQSLLQADEGTRRKELNSLRATNELLYSAVKQKMEEARAQGASEGRKSVSNPA